MSPVVPNRGAARPPRLAWLTSVSSILCACHELHEVDSRRAIPLRSNTYISSQEHARAKFRITSSSHHLLLVLSTHTHPPSCATLRRCLFILRPCAGHMYTGHCRTQCSWPGRWALPWPRTVPVAQYDHRIDCRALSLSRAGTRRDIGPNIVHSSAERSRLCAVGGKHGVTMRDAWTGTYAPALADCRALSLS